MSFLNVLWFSLSPCGSIRLHNEARVIQGWMISLEDEIKKISNIKLSVVYLSDKREAPFYFDGVTYYPVWNNRPKNKVGKFLYRLSSYKKYDSIILTQLINIVDIVKPDLIHIHGTEECFGMISNYVDNIPIVFSIQGMLAPYKEKFFSGISACQIIKYESILDRMKGISFIKDYNILSQKANREILYLKTAKYILGRTSWDKNITKLFNPDRKYFIVNEILRYPFYNKEWKKCRFSDTIQLVSIVSIGVYKGYETLLKTASLLKEYAPFEFEWNVIGYESNTRIARIVHKITNINPLYNSIKFLGRLDANDIVEVLLKSDIYCHVSHIENSPNSVCEAMLLGLPIIASSVGGTSSLLENNKEGLLYQDGDPYILAGDIIYMVSNFDEAKQMGNNARKRALDRHKTSNVVSELISAYNNILVDK